MEAESAVAVLQCFLDLDNFYQLISSSSSSSSPRVMFECTTAQDDAIIIYDKYVSMTQILTGFKQLIIGVTEA